MDLDKVQDISSDGPSKSFAFRRLQYLEGRWNLYVLLNEHQEMGDSKVGTLSPGDLPKTHNARYETDAFIYSVCLTETSTTCVRLTPMFIILRA